MKKNHNSKQIPDKIGRYKIVNEIGRGNMGVVYKGMDPEIERPVAIKTIHFDPDYSVEKIKELHNQLTIEAKAAGRISHPNIVTIYDAGTDKNIYYVAMEYVEGEDLEKKCPPGDYISLEEVADIVSQIASALDYAHKNGIVHRDIKPANIIIDKEGRVRVNDFGIARITASDITDKDTIMGTPLYMSPELVSKKEVDGRSDLFSLGVLLYRILTGETPFYGENVYKLMEQIKSAEPTPVTDLRKELSPKWNKVIKKILSKEPKWRYQTGELLMADIKGIMEDKDTGSTAVETLEDIYKKRDELDKILKDKFHKKVAIMFSDIMSSTAYFDARGDIEGRMMVKRHNDILFPIIEKNGGKIIKTIGDGVMSSFPKAIQASKAASDIQISLYEHNEDKKEKDQIWVKIGIHYDEGIVEENDVYGEVVNAAARIQSLAGSSEILVSKNVYDEVCSVKDINIKFKEEAKVKGVSKPIQVYKIYWREGEEFEEEKKAAFALRGGEEEKTFILELSRSGDELKICAYEREKLEKRTLRNYEKHDAISWDEINKYC
ncbi:MAG: protein kinase, partial [Thermodesulfobacteriota bacterium]|nr:protein kinase [Thermodesulfobacteriota bacterium]